MSIVNLANQIQANSSKVWNGKEAIATKIIEKGGQVYHDENSDGTQAKYLTFQNLVDGIDTLPTGGGNTLLVPQCHQTAIAGYSVSDTGNLKVKLGTVADETYDKSYLCVREGSDGVTFPISENELIEVGSNVASYEILGTAGETKYSVLAISKDIAGNYLTMPHNNELKGICGVTINIDGKYIEAILPEALQGTTDINAILNKNGQLYVTSNSSSIPGLWTFDIESKSFVKLSDTIYGTLRVLDYSDMSFLVTASPYNVTYRINSDNTLTAVTEEGTHTYISSYGIETSYGKKIAAYSGRFYVYNEETEMFEMLANLTYVSPSKYIELANGDVLVLSDNYDKSAAYYTNETNTFEKISAAAGGYISHHYINGDLILVLERTSNTQANLVKFIDKSNAITGASVSCYVAQKARLGFQVDNYGYVHFGNEAQIVNLDTMTFETAPEYENLNTTFGFQDENNVVYGTRGITNGATKLYATDVDGTETEIYTLATSTSSGYVYAIKTKKLSTTKYFLEICGMAGGTTSANLYSMVAIFNTETKTIENISSSTTLADYTGLFEYNDYQEIYPDILLAKGTIPRTFDLTTNTLVSLSNYRNYYAIDGIHYVFPSGTGYVRKIDENGAFVQTDVYTNGYMYSGLSRGYSDDAGKIFKGQIEIGTFEGTYTGTPTSNDGIRSFMFDTTSGTNRILFTY